MAQWILYVLVSNDHTRTYVGITNDLSRRLAQHNGEQPGGAKATRAGRPWSLGTTFGPFETRGQAQAAEYRLKRRSGRARLLPTALDECVSTERTSARAGKPRAEDP